MRAADVDQSLMGQHPHVERVGCSAYGGVVIDVSEADVTGEVAGRLRARREVSGNRRAAAGSSQVGFLGSDLGGECLVAAGVVDG